MWRINMTRDDFYHGMLDWEYWTSAEKSIWEKGIPIYNNKFIGTLHKKDSIEIPIPITGNAEKVASNYILHALVVMTFDKRNAIYKYLKNYKKLIDTFFIHSSNFYYYDTDQFTEKYFIGRGILTDDEGNILCLMTRNYIKDVNSEGKTVYTFNSSNSMENITIYLSPKLISSPRNAFEKFFIKNIYFNALNWDISRIIIDSNINKLFILDKNNITSREDLQVKLNKIAESSENIIDSIEEYE